MALTNLRTLLSVAAISLGSAAVADDVTLSTYRGDTQVAKAPKTIVALDIAAVDTLNALNVPLAGVPGNLYVNYLDQVAASAKPAGSLFEPDFEAIAMMAPDLIVAGGRSSKQYEALAEIAPTIDMTIWGEGHMDIALDRLRGYGALMGKEAEAAALEAKFNAALSAAQEAVADKGTALIVLTNGPKVSVYGKGSRFGWVHEALNLPETVEGVDAQTHGEAVSFEFIAEANPDWMLVVDRAAAIGQKNDAAKTTLDNALVAKTTAWQKGQVIYLNAADIYIAGGGYQSVMRTLDDITHGFNGDR
ncbi:siderophore ABC transporter substrate-binding protein [Thalassobius sp. Cn5-15]|uniref:siderophore ABC transporter substrate-binding protein n=1 Tax=Thalassobius sp. Cn5-15 TaxID=2917763 RepID=UPI001EF23BA4|nr:siderophore ABC transporter substrate-binding protein [Thalassobius sp. Cn5-15]MCG7494232.1 siderophore ABC transporter substrate-binding protein [Thalassobius sp. Cn5-15]